MVKIYKDKRTDKLFVLDELITMGEKVCLVPFDKGEDKFVSPSTLKRWFCKWDEAPFIIEVRAFTGMKIGLFKPVTYNRESVTVLTKDNKFLDFDAKTGEQTNAKNPKFANKTHRIYGWMY